MPTAAERIIEFLAAQGIDRAFCVPGESYIALLDALHAHNRVDLVTCRSEGGAGFMAVADAKLTGRPGVALVSRGPGACNASIAVHTAEQDATPFILLIGQVEKRDLRRNAFQEIDYQNMFRGVAKWVGELTDPDQAPEFIARAYAMAMGGVPGPVVLSLPEDVLAMECRAPLPPATLPSPLPPSPADAARLAALLRGAERPILLAGHGFESAAGRAALRGFAEAWQLPVAVSFRRQDLFDNRHPLYAGDLGLRNPDAQRQAFAEADLVLAFGTRLTDITTQGWSWPAAGQRLVHVCADPRFLGWLFPAELAIAADAQATIGALAAEAPAAPAGRAAWNARLRDLHVSDCQVVPAEHADGIAFAEVAKLIERVAPPDAIVTLDAGTFGAPFYRKVAWTSPQRLLCPVSGAMGFGVPAAAAAALRCPDRPVFGLVGDGGALMTGGELAVAVARGASLKLVLSDNGAYASIRIHQEKAHPGRIAGTMLINPDFAQWCAAFRVPVTRIDSKAEFPALEAALRAPGPGAIVVRTSLEAVLPRRLAAE
ncbi:thiamine pyrophosphate-dependent enzyme [Siccirubricoccus sp. KC 17139]|uniref:Thiamine pyrophosphate-dependent enzyme n=1 Tax=Siccirubricoccus soli TaxID=2899147 RepID=A0ABT1D7A2_9PROT|nr:thiamine pyrophosphate-binding protein [Siccirubricoccus soli]MCO6417482.1 thiamine pyrophosphate-dependent enzyme [Siccirubricoccus soli]MCP2683617.1 thiamine pyrophosphate-binding protein [Siccirubricoccus soli]